MDLPGQPVRKVLQVSMEQPGQPVLPEQQVQLGLPELMAQPDLQEQLDLLVQAEQLDRKVFKEFKETLVRPVQSVQLGLQD